MSRRRRASGLHPAHAPKQCQQPLLAGVPATSLAVAGSAGLPRRRPNMAAVPDPSEVPTSEEQPSSRFAVTFSLHTNIGKNILWAIRRLTPEQAETLGADPVDQQWDGLLSEHHRLRVARLHERPVGRRALGLARSRRHSSLPTAASRADRLCRGTLARTKETSRSYGGRPRNTPSVRACFRSRISRTASPEAVVAKADDDRVH